MRLTLVRHARAGEKRSWVGPDHERPLDSVGERHAAALVTLLVKHKVRRIVTSPTRRCVQTMQPLADATGVAIETWDALGPDGHALRLMATCFGSPDFDDAILCTHGEVLQTLLRIGAIRDLARRDKLTRDRLLTKGSAWRLTIATDGRPTKLVLYTPEVDR